MTAIIDCPEAGYYQMKLKNGGVMVAVKLWYGPPPDPHQPGELLDRSWRWQGLVDGRRWRDVYELWTRVADAAISESEYQFLLARGRWARRRDPDQPWADPSKPVDWLNIPPPQFRK